MDIDKILNVIKRKVLEGTHLPLTIKEIQAGYLTSLYFKDIYRYLAQNILPRKRHGRQKVENLSERYVLLDSLLFKLNPTPGRKRHFWIYQRYVWIRLSCCIMHHCLQGIRV